MKKLALIAIMTLITACSNTTLYVGQGIEVAEYEGYKDPLTIVTLRTMITENVSCELMHISLTLNGFPFNDKFENTADIIGCGYTFTLID